MKINEALDLDGLGQEFQTNKIIEVNNFLEESDAESLRTFLFTDIAEDWWSTSIHINRGEHKNPIHLRRTPENHTRIQELSVLAAESFSKDIFSYIFDRTLGDHFKTCPCKECAFRKVLGSPELLGTISRITGYAIQKPNEIFCSRYTSGQFLAPHHDKSRGKIGFVYNLSKNWKPEYGGNLHMMEEDYFTVKKTITPKFNNLILFDIPSYSGIPHFVSHIAPGVNNKRVSITGWFE